MQTAQKRHNDAGEAISWTDGTLELPNRSRHLANASEARRRAPNDQAKPDSLALSKASVTGSPRRSAADRKFESR